MSFVSLANARVGTASRAPSDGARMVVVVVLKEHPGRLRNAKGTESFMLPTSDNFCLIYLSIDFRYLVSCLYG